MFNFQTYIKSIRESKDLNQDTVANATNLSIETIKLIEEANSTSLLQSSDTLLKNQIRRYCEYLEIKEKKIISILNKLDILYYKKSRYGKLKPFDYLNRLVILGLIIAIGLLGYQHIEKNLSSTSSISNPQDSKSSIIYTPVDYDVQSINNRDTNPIENNKTDNDVINDNKNKNQDDLSTESKLTNTKEDSIPAPKSLRTSVAHPPISANMDDIVIDDPDSKSIDFNS